MNKKIAIILHKSFSMFAGLTLVAQSLAPGLFVLATNPAVVFAQEETPTPTVEQTPTPTQDSTPTPEVSVAPSDTPTPEASPTATPDVTIPPTPTPTGDILPDGASTVAPTQESAPQSNQDQEPNNNSPPQATDTPTIPPTPTVIASSEEGQITAVIYTDKSDYSPTEVALIFGNSFTPNETYTLNITSDNLNVSVNVTADENGNFAYSYQLDGTYRPLYNVVAKDWAGTVVATTSFTDSQSSPTIAITNINGTGGPPFSFSCPNNPLLSPVTISGSGTGSAPPGDASQYHVQVDWGDGQVTNGLGTFTPNSGHVNFTFTFSAGPHTYVTGGSFTIKARLYHSQPPGADNQADSVASVTVCIVVQNGGLTVHKTFTDQHSNSGITINVNPGNLSQVTNGSGDATFSNLTPGTYSATAVEPSGYYQSATTCTNVSVTAGQTANCTITDSPILGTITVHKVITGTTTAFSNFCFTLSPNPGNGQICANGSGDAVFNNVPAGSYTASETASAASYTQTNTTCNSAMVIANNGDSKSCTVTNTRDQGSITVHKLVDTNGDSTFETTDSGANTLGFRWGLDSVTPARLMGTTASSVPTGSHTVDENSVTDYHFTGWYRDNGDGSCSNPDSTSLPAAIDVFTDVTTAITLCNARDSGTLTVVKSLSPSNDPGLFDLQVDEVTKKTDAGDTDSTGAVTVLTGNHTVSEVAGTATSLSDYDSHIDCDNDQSGSGTSLSNVSVTKDSDVTCTITNTRKTGSVTFEKIVSGGAALASDWTFSISGVGGTFHSGDATTLNTGTYAVSESGPANYTPSSVGGICSNLDGESATLTVTEEGGTCTFTNTQDTGTVTVHKKLDSDGDGRFEGGDSEANVLGFRWGLDSETPERNMGTSLPGVETGKHSVSEALGAGYIYLGWYHTGNEDFSCTNPESTDLPSFDVNKDQTVNITLCNQFQNPQLQISKTNDKVDSGVGAGGSILYTIFVSVTGADLNDVQVTDLLPKGFVYHPGSFTANSSIHGALSIEEPTYHSPGVWSLGNMSKGETITLTLLADVDGSQQGGTYWALSWAKGTSLAATTVLSTAPDGSTFVGTPTAIANSNQPGTGVNIATTGEVLGASTSLPATGADSKWLVLASILLTLGLGSTIIGYQLRRKNV